MLSLHRFNLIYMFTHTRIVILAAPEHPIYDHRAWTEATLSEIHIVRILRGLVNWRYRPYFSRLKAPVPSRLGIRICMTTSPLCTIMSGSGHPTNL